MILLLSARWAQRIALATIASALIVSTTGCNEAPSAPPARELTLRVVHPPEVSGLLSNLAEEFTARGHKLRDGQMVRLELVSAPTFEASSAIAKGFLKTHLWLAPGSGYVDFTNRDLENLGPKQENCAKVFHTPVVAAVQNRHRSKLATRGREIDLQLLLSAWQTGAYESADGTAQISQQSGAAIAHGSVGTSDTGFAALLQLAAAAGYRPDSTHAITSEPEARLKEFEHRVVQYSSRDWLLLGRAVRMDELPLVVITTEQRLASFNLGQAGKSTNLVALYPQADAMVLDYQLCISAADWMTAAHHAAAKLLIEFVRSPTSQKAIAQRGFRPELPTTEPTEPLVAKYGVDLSLPQSRSETLSPSFILGTREAWPRVMRRAAVLAIVDTSGSMEGLPLKSTKDQLRLALAKLAQNDLKGLISFSAETSLSAPLTSDASLAIAELDKLQARGGSAPYDALKQAYEILSDSQYAPYRRVIVLITDGSDKNSVIGKEELARVLKLISSRADIALFIVGLQHEGTSFNDFSSLATELGAIFRESTVQELSGVFKEVHDNL